MDILAQKKCGKCKEIKPITEFSNDRSRPDELCTICKKCASERGKKYFQDHHDARSNRQREYYKENRELIRERSRQRYSENPQKSQEATRRWSRNNPGKQDAQQLRWRETHKEHIAQKVKQWANDNRDKRALTAEIRRVNKAKSGGKITIKEWRDLLEKYNYTCLCCGRTDVKLTLDHVIPLSKGGAHTIENSQPLCGSCNSRKHTKIIDYRPGKL